MRDDKPVTANLKTGLVLGSVAVVFFIGVVIRHWVW
jgi:hypothetical protein